MRVRSIVICSLIFSVRGFCQITITQADIQNAYHAGASFHLDSAFITGPINIGLPSSSPQIFDFSGMNFKPDSIVTVILNSSTTPFVDSFPASQLALSIPSQFGTIYAYFGFDDSGFISFGASTPFGLIRPNPPELQALTPMMYGASWTYQSDTSEYILGDGQFITMKNKADAFGTIKIGNDSFACIRVRTYDSTGTFSPGSAPIYGVSIQYAYYMENGSVVRIGVDSAQGEHSVVTPTSFIYAHPGDTVVNSNDSVPFIQSQSALAFSIKQANAIARTRYVRLKNIGKERAVVTHCRISGIDSGSFSFNFSNDTIFIAGGQDYSLQVSFIPDKIGTKYANLTFRANDSIANHSVSLSGEAVDSPYLYPANICFPSGSGGDTTFDFCNAIEDTVVVSSPMLKQINGSVFVLTAPSAFPLNVLPGDCLPFEVRAMKSTAKDSTTLNIPLKSSSINILMTTNCDEPNDVREQVYVNTDRMIVQHYPEPFDVRATFIVVSSAPLDPKVSLSVYDLFGRCVAKFNSRQFIGGEVTLDGSNFPAGEYSWRLQSGTKTEFGSMVHIK